MTPERIYELADELGVAKNRQDVATALAFMHDDIWKNVFGVPSQSAAE